MRYLVCSDIHLNVNRRFEDTVAALDRVTEKAEELDVDQVLILGDVYTSRRPYAREREAFQKWVKKITEPRSCPPPCNPAYEVTKVVILRGNHDESPDGSHSFTEFTALSYPNVTVLENPTTYQESENDPGLFLGHLLLREACIGADNVQVADAEWTVERLFREFPGRTAYLLGDVHKHQFLHKDPPVVYAGSIEHVDFAERNDPKGVLLVETGETTTVKFVPLKTRPMLQYDLYHPFVVEPTRIEDGSIVKVVFHGTKEQIIRFVDEKTVRSLFEAAKELTIQYDVTQDTAPRNKQVNESITPEKALELYLANKDLPEQERIATQTLGLEVIKRCHS